MAFVDAGGNFEAIYCPACDHTLAVGWWQERMDAAFATRFTDLALTTGCCGCRTTLNDLRYVWPQGFSRWVLEVENPGRGRLSADEISTVEQAIGHAVRQIWTHI